jgi:UDP-N-acetylglucosamine transferase subunit ALG13
LIFVTVGTHQQPFERLIGALDQLEGSELVVQHGPAKAPAGVARAEPYMPFEEIVACMREADAVITHAGVGSILCARREGHTPVIVPRRRDLGEHVDDHQAELTRALEPRGGIVAVWDVADLAASVAGAPPRESRHDTAEPSLCASVRAALLGDQASEA